MIAADQLRLFIERIERLEEEKKGIADDISDVYAEAKSDGFDTKIMRECVKLRKLERHALQDRDALLDTYRTALGMDFAGTPLGQAAAELDRLAGEDGGTATLEMGGETISTFGSRKAA